MKENVMSFWQEIVENVDTFLIIAGLQVVLLILVMFLIVSDEKSDIR